MSGEGLDNQFIHSDGLNIHISNIYAERAIESLWSLYKTSKINVAVAVR